MVAALWPWTLKAWLAAPTPPNISTIWLTWDNVVGEIACHVKYCWANLTPNINTAILGYGLWQIQIWLPQNQEDHQNEGLCSNLLCSMLCWINHAAHTNTICERPLERQAAPIGPSIAMPWPKYNKQGTDIAIRTLDKKQLCANGFITLLLQTTSSVSHFSNLATNSTTCVLQWGFGGKDLWLCDPSCLSKLHVAISVWSITLPLMIPTTGPNVNHKSAVQTQLLS